MQEELDLNALLSGLNLAPGGAQVHITDPYCLCFACAAQPSPNTCLTQFTGCAEQAHCHRPGRSAVCCTSMGWLKLEVLVGWVLHSE